MLARPHQLRRADAVTASRGSSGGHANCNADHQETIRMCSDTGTIGVAQCAPDKSRFPGDGASGAVFRASLGARHFRLLVQPCRPEWCQLGAPLTSSRQPAVALLVCSAGVAASRAGGPSLAGCVLRTQNSRPHPQVVHGSDGSTLRSATGQGRPRPRHT